MNKLLFLIALIPILVTVAAPSSHNVFALSTNQTSSNETNTLLKQIKVELEHILAQLQAPPTLPQPPHLENILPPPSSFNGTICKDQNDAGVLVTCPPGMLPSPLPLPPPSLILPPPIPPSLAIPVPPSFTPDCINTIYGVFCPFFN